MKLTKTAALIVAALVVGLVAGNVVSASAATDTSTATSATAGLGLRLGAVMRDAGGRLVDIVADLTGLSADDVEAQRQDGTSFADIAATKDVTSAEVVDAALKVRSEILADRVEAGTITQDQADAALDRMETRLSERVTSTDACTGGGGGMMGGGRGRGGMMGGGGRGAGACGGTCTQAPVTQ